MAATQDESDLGEMICDRTPYGPMTMPANWKNEVEWDGLPTYWTFRGQSHRVKASIRIPVTITVNGFQYRDWLIIGYEGHGP